GVGTCIRGEGAARIGAQRFGVARHDVWNTPSMHPITYENTGRDLMARLTFTNRPLLEKLSIYVQEEAADDAQTESWFAESGMPAETGPRAKDNAPIREIGGG